MGFCRWRYVFNLSRDLAWPPHWEGMQTYGLELPVLCHYGDKSCDHKYCSGEDMFLVCHVTSREHMFKGLCEFMGWSPSRWVTILPCLVNIGLVQVEIYLACHVNLQNHVIEGSRNFMLGAFHVYITNLPSLVVIGIVLVEMFEKWSSKPTKLQGQVTITIGTPQGKSPSYQNWLLYGHCGIGDTFLVRHTILQGEVIKRSSDFIGKSPSR